MSSDMVRHDTTPPSERADVPPMTAMSLVYRLTLRQLLTRARVIGLVALGAIVVAIAVAVGRADDVTDADAVRVISEVGFTLVVPIVALVFAAASLGDLRDDRTLVYLWLRPMDRWPIVVGAWLASITISLPLTVIPLGIAAIALDVGSGLLGATVLAAVVGVIAYAALFVLGGLLLKNAIVWGVGYVLIWEGVVAAFGSFPARLSIRGYTRSILTSQTGIDLDLGDLGTAAGTIAPLAIAAGALVAASWRLRTMEID